MKINVVRLSQHVLVQGDRHLVHHGIENGGARFLSFAIHADILPVVENSVELYVASDRIGTFVVDPFYRAFWPIRFLVHQPRQFHDRAEEGDIEKALHVFNVGDVDVTWALR